MEATAPTTAVTTTVTPTDGLIVMTWTTLTTGMIATTTTGTDIHTTVATTTGTVATTTTGTEAPTTIPITTMIMIIQAAIMTGITTTLLDSPRSLETLCTTLGLELATTH